MACGDDYAARRRECGEKPWEKFLRGTKGEPCTEGGCAWLYRNRGNNLCQSTTVLPAVYSIFYFLIFFLIYIIRINLIFIRIYAYFRIRIYIS